MNLYYPQLPVGRGLTAGLTAGELDAVDGCLESARACRAAGPARPWRRGRADRRGRSSASTSSACLTATPGPASRATGYLGSVPQDERARLGARARRRCVERYRALWLGRQPARRSRRQPDLAAEPAGRLRDRVVRTPTGAASRCRRRDSPPLLGSGATARRAPGDLLSPRCRPRRPSRPRRRRRRSSPTSSSPRSAGTPGGTGSAGTAASSWWCSRSNW